MKRILATLALVLVVVGVWSAPALAATSDDIVITATPSFISISIAQDTWTINGISGDSMIDKATTYYANPLGDVTAPSNPVVDGECYFTIANTSTVVTDITANLPTFVGGDAMTNTNNGYATNGANAFGASTYISGAAWPAGVVILKDAASAVMKASLAATTDLKFGVAIKTKSGDFGVGTAMTGTITVTATEHV